MHSGIDRKSPPVVLPRAAEYVARGAARPAAWVLSGGTVPPQWPGEPAVVEAQVSFEEGQRVRARYDALFDSMYGTS